MEYVRTFLVQASQGSVDYSFTMISSEYDQESPYKAQPKTLNSQGETFKPYSTS